MDTHTPPKSARRAPKHRGLRLGSLFGVEIVAHWSLLLIFALVLISVGGALEAGWHPEWSPALRWSVATAAAVAFFASVLLHELSHALVGRAQGIPVNRITLFVFGGMAHMEGRPPTPKSELLMAAVGPLVSLVIGVVAGWAGMALAPELTPEALAADPQGTMASVGAVATVLLWLGPINILLGLFNLVPGFPLDGGRVLRALIWWGTGDRYKATLWSTAVGQGVGVMLIAVGVLMAFGVRMPIFGVGVIPGLWMALIGWFLKNAAMASLRHHVVGAALEGAHVADLMARHPDVVSPDLSVERFAREHVLESDQVRFPVIDAERHFLGMVSARSVGNVPADDRASTKVVSLMTPAHAIHPLHADDDAEEAMRRLASGEDDQPVVDHGELQGLVRRSTLARYVAMSTDAEAA